ncbi:MAG: hypothetical protein LUH00_00800 [Lachnospiraceae bacterium]|nr:hypothetical protein [Lachnospiraceae bacterium]
MRKDRDKLAFSILFLFDAQGCERYFPAVAGRSSRSEQDSASRLLLDFYLLY